VLELDNRTTLLDALREHLHLTAPRRAATTASAAPAPCSWTAAHQFLPDAGRDAPGREGHHHRRPGHAARLHPLQAAFVKHDGYQCGYCTPGQICSAVGALDEIRRGIPSHVTRDLTAGRCCRPRNCASA
jgi:xanthine dehydrogenase YagT iron-sulfur-binding subunit